MSYLVYDCEILNAIPGGSEGEYDDISYCSGWGDFGGMGISVIGYYRADVHEYGYAIIDGTKSGKKLFRTLVKKLPYVIGFNSRAFDDVLCRFNDIEIHTTYDLLEEVRAASGQPKQYTPGVTRKGYDLDSLAKANLSKGKSGKGDKSPILWQRGAKEEVIDYCLNDVRLTHELWLKRQSLKDPTDNKLLSLSWY